MIFCILALRGESLNPSPCARYVYSSPPDLGLEKLVDRPYNQRRSRMVDRWLEYSDLEGFTTAGKVVQL